VGQRDEAEMGCGSRSLVEGVHFLGVGCPNELRSIRMLETKKSKASDKSAADAFLKQGLFCARKLRLGRRVRGHIVRITRAFGHTCVRRLGRTTFVIGSTCVLISIVATVAIVAMAPIIRGVIAIVRVAVGVVRIVVRVRAPPRAISVPVRVSPIGEEAKVESVAVARIATKSAKVTAVKAVKTSVAKTAEVSAAEATKISSTAAKTAEVSAAVKTSIAAAETAAMKATATAKTAAASAALGKCRVWCRGERDRHCGYNKNSEQNYPAHLSFH
jgi:hypothetical protein